MQFPSCILFQASGVRCQRLWCMLMQSKPPHAAYTVLWEACAREQRSEVALELLRWAGEDGIEPTICDLLSLLASQPARKRSPLARKLLKVMTATTTNPYTLHVCMHMHTGSQSCMQCFE